MTDLAKVAEALGWQRSGTQIYPRRALGCVIDTGRPLDMNGAWLVVEAMEQRGWEVALFNFHEKPWGCEMDHVESKGYAYVDGLTAPAAIVAAAAKALEVSDD